MQGEFTFIAIMVQVIMIVMFIVMALMMQGKNKSIKELYERIAQQRSGEIVAQKIFGLKYGSALSIPVGGTHILLNHFARSKNSPPRTFIRCNILTQNNYRLVVTKQGFWSKMQKKFGGQDIKIGNPAFDEAFMVQSNNEMLIRSLLDPELQQDFINLKDQVPFLMINNKKLDFSIPTYLKDERVINQFIDVALRIVNKAHNIG